MFINYPTRIKSVVAQIQTLPHLPENTLLSTDNVESERLLEELLIIDPKINPLQWLMDHHNDICVKLLLWQELDKLRSNVLSMQRHIALREMDSIGLGKRDSLDIGYRFNQQDLRLLKPLANTSPLTVDDSHLLQIFSKLRRREMVDVTSDRRNTVRRNLRNKLLSLPYDVNPLVWLRDNHLQHAALSTLEYLIGQVIPIEMSVFSSRDSSRFESHSLQAVSRARGIKFVLDNISYVRAAFAIRITFRISDGQLQDLDKTRLSANQVLIEWRGVGNVSDDLGNRYLICHSILNSSSVVLPNRNHIDYRLRLNCYPTIANRVSKLSLRFDDVTLVAMKTPAIKPIFYAVQFEDLKWTVDIAALRR